MKSWKTVGVLLLIALLGSLLNACAPTLQARKVDVGQALLVDPAILQEGGPDQALYRYASPEANFRKYTKLVIDPVIIYQGAEVDADTLENYQNLANNGYAYLQQELGQDYTLVPKPEPGAMRLQFAIINAEKEAPVRNFLSTLVPIGMAVSTVKYAATGKPAAVGEITAELKVTDAGTGKLLGAALDKRVGGKQLRGAFTSWQDADSALAYWAKKIRYILCTERGGTSCEKP